MSTREQCRMNCTPDTTIVCALRTTTSFVSSTPSACMRAAISSVNASFVISRAFSLPSTSMRDRRGSNVPGRTTMLPDHSPAEFGIATESEEPLEPLEPEEPTESGKGMEPTALAAVTTIWNSPEWMKEKRKTQASSSAESRYGWTFE